MNESKQITKRQLRIWGASTGAGLTALGSIVYLWRGHEWGKIPLALAALFIFFGLTTLPPAKLLFRGWHAFVDAVLWLWTRVALILTYFIAFTPISIIARIVGRDRMRLGFPGGKETYWEDHATDERSDRYRRQF